LSQVVANLLNNAAKYTERGGRIEVTLSREGGVVRIAVRDNGVGLAPDALEKIFELFLQLPASRTDTQGGGLGIGLTLVRRLVELHEGTVAAHSDGAHRGSEMVVQLPAPTEELTAAAPARPPHVPEDSRPGSLRILAVDDNVMLADSLAKLLGMWGHA